MNCWVNKWLTVSVTFTAQAHCCHTHLSSLIGLTVPSRRCSGPEVAKLARADQRPAAAADVPLQHRTEPILNMFSISCDMPLHSTLMLA